MNEPIKSIEEFISWTEQLEGRFLLFRGLADASWEVSASAYRRIKPSPENVPAPSIFQNYMKQLLNNASLRGFREQQGKSLSDLELLATLQHHGAATCLIDFTSNPLAALWFACQENQGSSGKVVAMPTDKIDLFSTVTYQDLEKSIAEFLYKDKLWKWIPSHLSNRIVAQQSVFVFGQGKIEEAHYKEVRIDGGSKQEIRNELGERFGINEQHLFSDFTGFSLSNAHDKPYNDYTADDYFSLGMEFHQRGGFQKALDAYDQAIKLNPRGDASVYNNRGNAKYALGDKMGAIADYSKSIELFPHLFTAYYGRGATKGTLGHYQEAIIDYDKSIELNPHFAEAYNNRGNAKDALGDHKGAIGDYNKAVELNPQYIEAYYNRGVTKQALGDHHGAISDCDKSISLNPQFVEAYFNRGNAKGALGDHQGAIADYNKCIELNPQYFKAYFNRGKNKIGSGDHKGAIADFDKAIEINPQHAEAHYNRGLAKSCLFDVQEAISDYDSAIEYNPQYIEAYFSRGVAKFGLKDYQGAMSDYDMVIELNPQYTVAYHNRGIAKRESGDEAGANEDSAKAEQLIELQNRQSTES